MKLNPIYSKLIMKRPSCNNFKFSALKDENVVNPPQTPVARNNRRLPELNSAERNPQPAIIPITKLPAILTNSVGQGKLLAGIIDAAANRNILPIAPPNP